MTQEQFTEIQNMAAMMADEDSTNDFYTILESLIEEMEE